ncbi:outer membrane protein assembly factor BamB family protein [Streptacidiphilus rugosus]|uniref:outer membrane protein assembly factor BamB family protein n=1 Tax=Streptacidiphilus rugosus TaxID=405783 RepID=UPI00055AD063|nr:PQQ-binding-like beta-propeller repeat protein [Streptacidiphilus rugosus]
MEREENTASRQEEQPQYWQQPYDAYGQQQYDYSGYGTEQQPQQQYWAQPEQGGGYDPATAYDPAAYQQQGYEQQSYQPQYQATGYEQQPYADPTYGSFPEQTSGYEQQPGYEQSQGYDQQYYDPAAYQQQQYYDPQQYAAAYYEQQTAPAEQAPWSGEPGESDESGATAVAAVPAQPSAPEQESTPAGATAVGRSEAAGGDRGTGGAGLRARVTDAAMGRGPGVNRKSYVTRLAVGGGALVVLAGAAYFVAGNGSGGSQPGGGAKASQADIGVNHTKAWAAPADAGASTGAGGAAAGTSNDGLIGSWLLAGSVVRGDGEGVTAYAAADGHKLWSVAPPAAGAVPCAVSPDVNSAGIGAVVFQAKPGTGQACNTLVAVDTATGASKWNAKLPTTTGAGGFASSVMVDDTRVVAVTDSAAVGYDMTGKQSWSYAGPGKYCALAGNGDGTALLLQSTCADTTVKQQAISLDPGTGKLRWWRGLPQAAASYTVLSASPAVVSVHMSDPTKDTLVSFTDKGDPQAAIPVAQTGGTLDSTHGSFDPDPELYFTPTTLVAAVEPSAQSAAAASGPTVIAAYNLVDGKELWRTTAQEKGVAAPVGIDGTTMIVATDERVGQPARLSHFDLTTGKETVGGTFPQGTGSLLGSGRVLFRASMVVALPEFTGSYNTSVTAWKAAAS